MEDSRDKPLSQQYDLSYVRRTNWPHSLVRWLSLAGVALVAAYFVFASFLGDERAYSSGPMTHAHAMFGNDCAQCHQPDPDSAGFWLPVQDTACLKCHVAEAHHGFEAMHSSSAMHVSDRLGRIPVAINCATCHVEHQGADHDLKSVPDAACVHCHSQLNQVRAEIQQLQNQRDLEGPSEPNDDADPAAQPASGAAGPEVSP